MEANGWILRQLHKKTTIFLKTLVFFLVLGFSRSGGVPPLGAGGGAPTEAPRRAGPEASQGTASGRAARAHTPVCRSRKPSRFRARIEGAPDQPVSFPGIFQETGPGFEYTIGFPGESPEELPGSVCATLRGGGLAIGMLS